MGAQRSWFATHLVAALVFAVVASLSVASTPVGVPSAIAVAPDRMELPERRTAISKTFRRPDGTFTTEVFSSPVHFRADGAWREIDSSLVTSTRPGYGFENKANGFKARFKSSLGPEHLRFEVGDRAIGLSLEGAAARSAQTEKRKVSYAQALPGVGLEYELLAEGVKETLVLASASAPTRYRFRLRELDGKQLVPFALPNGAWGFSASGLPDPLFVLAAPFVSDGRVRFAREPVSMTVRSEGAAGFAVELILDPEWLQAPERSFPVLLDPTITIRPPTQDATYFPGRYNDFLYDAFLEVGADSAVKRGLVQFDLSAVPVGANVTDAKLALYRYSCFGGTGCASGSHSLDVHRLTSAWDIYSSRSQDISFDATSVANTTSTGSDPSWLSWTVTNTVRDWVAGTSANHGLLLKRTTEPLNAGGPSFENKATADATLRPKLEVTYASDAVSLFVPETLRSNGASLRWTRFENSTGNPFVGYEVHRSASAGFVPSAATRIATIGDPDVTSYTDTTAKPSTTFSYKVVQNAVPSNEQRETLPAAGTAKKILQPDAASGQQVGIERITGTTSCSNYGASRTLWIGDSSAYRNRALLRFDLRDIPSGSTVTAATLRLHTNRDNNTSGTLRAHRATASWQEGTGEFGECSGDGATWTETQAGAPWTTKGGDFDTTVAGSVAIPSYATPRWYALTLTTLAQSWVNGQAPNHGVLLKLAAENASGAWFAAYSDDEPLAPQLRPKLEVTYADGSTAVAPTATLAKPTANELLAGSVELAAAAQDDGRTAQVEFLVDDVVVATDTSDPFTASWNSTSVANGNHTLKVRGTDDAGNVATSAGVPVTVDNSAPPATTVSAPGGTVSGDVTVTATATDNDPITKVEFFVDDSRFGEPDTTAPYSAVLPTLAIDERTYDGSHTLTTKAYTASGQVTTSAPAPLTVGNGTGTSYRAEVTTTAMPQTAVYDPAAPTQEQLGLDVTVKNTSTNAWAAGQMAVRYRWIAPEATQATTVEGGNVAVPALAAGATAAPLRLMVDPPALPIGVERSQYRLQADVYESSSNSWFGDKGNKPAEQPVVVKKALETALGLERYYHYVGEDLGAGMQHLVNVASGDSIVRWTPFMAPGRGLSTVVDLTYNALEKKCECPAGNNWSLSISSLTRFGNPLDVHPNNADSIAGRSNKYIEFTDGDGTTHRFTSTDGVTYTKPAGVHLYLRRYSTTDLTRKWALTRPDRVTFFYDSEGYPTSVEDKNGQRITFTLENTPSGEDPGGPKKRITEVTDAGGRKFLLDYYSKAEAKKAHIRGRIQRITDHSGSALDFAYYEDGNLLRLTQRGGTKADGSALADRSFVFTYTDSAGNGPAIPNAADRVDPAPRTSNQSTRLYSVRDPRGVETLFAYLGSGNGNDRWKLASRTDRSGAVTSIAYAAGETTVTAPLSRVSKYAFDGEGKVTRITNPKNEATLVEWTSRHVTKVTEPTGKFVEFAYNQNGYLTDEWDQLRNRTQLAYRNEAVDANDAAQHVSVLVSKTEPEGMKTATPTTDYQWTFGYDAAFKNLTSVTDPLGHSSVMTYNGDGTVATIRDANLRTTTFVQYDLNGLPTEILDAKGQTTRLGYDVDGLLRWIQDPLHASSTGANEREYKSFFDYDAFHRLGRQSAPKSTEFERGTLIWSGVDYDANDNVVTQLSPDYAAGAGERTTIAHDAMDRATLVTNPDTSVDPAGERTKLEYDAAGRLSRLTLPKGVLTTANPDDFVTESTYDPLDRLVTSTRLSGDGQALRSHACFDLAGDLRWQTAPKAGLATAPASCTGTPPSHTMRYVYDDAHRLLTETDPLGRVNSVAYDANGDVTSSTDESGTVTTREYNQRGELIKLVEPFAKDAQGVVTRSLTTRLEYDPVGNLKREISPRAWDASADKQTFTQFVTTYVYDELNRLVTVELPSSTGGTQHYIHRGYDANGNLTLVSLPTAKPVTGLDANDKTVLDHFDTGWLRTTDEPANPKALFDYTAEGWQAKKTPYMRSDPTELNEARRILWTHNADGTLQRVNDRQGAGFTAYSYDANNNVLKADEGRGLDKTTVKALDVEASYDLFDRVTKTRRQEKGGTEWTFTKYVYDANDNVTSREQNGSEQTNGTLVSAGRKQNFTYDGADWLDTQLDHGKTAATTDDRLITNRFTPTGWEELRKIQARDGGGAFTVTKQETVWSWFANGKLKTLETKNGAGTVLENHTVSYEDAGIYLNGNRVKDVFRLQGPNASAACRTADCETRFSYDARERLVSETRVRGGSTATDTFELDPAGNIKTLTKPSVTQTFTYAGNQLRTLTQGTQTQKYWYDDEGNLDCVTTDTAGSSACNTPEGEIGSTQVYADYNYDYLNRLKGVKTFTLSGGTSTAEKVASYEYDALGRTSKQTEQHGVGDPRTTLYQHLGLSNDVANEEQTSGGTTVSKDYSYDVFGTRISLTDTRGGTSRTFSYGHDVHGSVSLLLKDSGQAQAAYGYTAYGEKDGTLTQEQTADGSGVNDDVKDPFNPYRYTGKRFDSGSGTLDMGARRFGPDTAHFLQADMYDSAFGNLGLSADPLTANRYGLAGGNPIGFLELDGHRVDESGNGTGTFTPNPNPRTGERSSRTWNSYTASRSIRNARIEGTSAGAKSGARVVSAPRPEQKESFLGGHGHTVLDAAGVIPLIGEPADLINCGWYASEGRELEAGLSCGAAIPVLGWGATAAKVGIKTSRAAEEAGGAGRLFTHFTDEAGARGIAGVAPQTVGERVAVNELHFGVGKNPYLASEPGRIFVTDLGADATSAQLDQIGVFGAKQNFAVQFFERDAFNSGAHVTGEMPSRNIYSIPGGCTITGACSVVRVR